MKFTDQLKCLVQTIPAFTVFNYISIHFPSANSSDIATEEYSTVVNYNLMYDLNDEAWPNYENISMIMFGNNTDYDFSYNNYLRALSEDNIDEALVWGLKTAVFIYDDEKMLSDIVNDNKYYQQYLSYDVLSKVTSYLEAKLGT